MKNVRRAETQTYATKTVRYIREYGEYYTDAYSMEEAMNDVYSGNYESYDSDYDDENLGDTECNHDVSGDDHQYDIGSIVVVDSDFDYYHYIKNKDPNVEYYIGLIKDQTRSDYDEPFYVVYLGSLKCEITIPETLIIQELCNEDLDKINEETT